MMRYASEDLVNEHEGILFGLSILEKMCGRLGGEGTADIGDFREIVDFLKLFADKCHHGKEEGLLFPAMERAGIAKENGPIGQMLYEHMIGRQHIARMWDAISGDAVEGRAFTEAAEGYIGLLRSHIEKENRILFPMGDRRIPEAEQRELLEAFEKFEEEVMGAGTHERLHGMLNAFAAKYLGA